MGRFLNPNNSAFQVALNSEIYVDKTGLLNYINKVLNTKQAFICNSRPRRFGKSVTADMLTAYYSKGASSEQMFAGLEISKSDEFEKHLNKYDVIHFDVQWCKTPAKGAEGVVAYIERAVIEELREEYADLLPESVVSLAEALSGINVTTGRRFIIIIDEWDVLIRDDAENQIVQEEYISFLRGLFKGSEPTKYIALAYLTGILPIKKLKTQSALNNFEEYTMLDARVFAPYIGFTEEEVKALCAKYDRDFEEVKRWYDGYYVDGYHIYNPKAVVSVLEWNKFQSYWSQTGSYQTIVPLINMDFDGLRSAIIEMISGAEVEVCITFFKNDMVRFESKDDVLTLLIHLGYLGYNQGKQTAFIPNEEIRQEFVGATRSNGWNELLEFQFSSMELLNATLDMEEVAVAEGIERIHSEYASVIQYNSENSLSSVLSIAYLSAMQYYFKPIRELPTGRGFADFVFIPKREYAADYPALVVELKWNKDVSTAIQQIKEKKYPESLLQYTGEILLVGINYDKKSKVHQCVIEKLQTNK
ncbi:MAG: AAA family ATPase [Lachnospiraceae bacterium]|nr:AAA family ATPase [Lachnospiraceae bacterium]